MINYSLLKDEKWQQSVRAVEVPTLFKNMKKIFQEVLRKVRKHNFFYKLNFNMAP